MDAYEKEVVNLKFADDKKDAEEQNKKKKKEEKDSADPEVRRAEIAARRAKLEQKKAATKEVKVQEEKAEEIFQSVVGEDATKKAKFEKRRLRRQTTLKEKQEAGLG